MEYSKISVDGTLIKRLIVTYANKLYFHLDLGRVDSSVGVTPFPGHKAEQNNIRSGYLKHDYFFAPPKQIVYGVTHLLYGVATSNSMCFVRVF